MTQPSFTSKCEILGLSFSLEKVIVTIDDKGSQTPKTIFYSDRVATFLDKKNE